MMGTDISSGNYAVMLMAQITSIQDPAQAVTAVRNLASRNADIYVIDESHSALPSNLWGILTQNQPYHVINGTVMTDIDELFITFDATLLQDFSNMHC
uniref:Uncharacterized protein n=1 Tax=Panagrolaimus superbus TaxID=310955 RepID=A0A914Y5S1_9BILA